MPDPTPDRYGRYRVRDRTNRRSGTWSTTIYNPDTMQLVSGAASDCYGAALPPKPWRPAPSGATPETPAPAGENTTTEEGDSNVG